MKTKSISPKTTGEAGSALLMTLILCGVALAILAAAMAWSASSARLTHRVIQLNCSQAAAEAATEKVIATITRDYMYGGETLVLGNLGIYQTHTCQPPRILHAGVTGNFNDGNGNLGRRTSVQRTTASSSGYSGIEC